nr:hypothetical protein [Dorea sp. Marseille-P4042]
MKYKVMYTAGAKKDLRNIFRYISEELLASENAAGQTERIMTAIRKLDTMRTEIGSMRKNRGTAEDFDSFQWGIIWYFTKQMMKLK